MNSRQLDEEAIFQVARGIADPTLRTMYLEQICAGDGQLRSRVETLLAAHESDASLRQSDRPEPAPTVESVPLSERPGATIGRYRLMEQIGEGGMGTVFVAEQERPIRRKVAIKVIKPGMDSKAVVARFEAERQALAMMDHPNIAKVLDAGTTESGRPYFAMELVKGVPITEYCDRSRLTIRERLALFVQVCHAIQHAHQKGIIHRDIKPSNVLITLHDGQPVPKVIDFGVAKAMNARLTDKTIYTEHVQVIGTLLYMSPEQAELSGLDVDTRSDIYSLGVLLYELLTGTTPFEKEELDKAGFDEQRRMIREEEPLRASVRISSLREKATFVAEHRSSDPKKLHQLVRGDLDWMVMKALEKDRTRRYETASALSADVNHFLGDEPVTACPPSVAYRFRKFARRNRTLLATVTLVSASLVLGVVTSLWLAIWAIKAERRAQDLLMAERQTAQREAEQRVAAEDARNRAQKEATRANSINGLLQQLLSSANPDSRKGRNYSVRELLDDFSTTLTRQSTNELADQPEVEAAVRSTIGQAYRRLDVLDKAEPHLKAALELRRRLFGNDHEEVAESLAEYGWYLFEKRDWPEAERYAREALEICRRRSDDINLLLNTYREVHFFVFKQGRYVEADAVAEEALNTAKRADSMNHPAVALILLNSAEIKAALGEIAEARALATEGMNIHRRVFGDDHPETGWALLCLAEFEQGLGELEIAEKHYRGALAVFCKYYDVSFGPVRGALLALKSILEAQGDQVKLEKFQSEFGDLLQQIEQLPKKADE